MILVLVLAAVIVTPPVQQLASWRGICEARFAVRVQAHPNNRHVTITLADEGGTFSRTEIPVSRTQVTMIDRALVLREDQTVTISTTVVGSSGYREHGAPARIICH